MVPLERCQSTDGPIQVATIDADEMWHFTRRFRFRQVAIGIANLSYAANLPDRYPASAISRKSSPFLADF